MLGFRRDAQGRALLGTAVLTELWQAVQQASPTYFYDLDGMAATARELISGFAGRQALVAYAIKANSAGSIVRRLAAEGVGADVVSGAELELVLGAGIAPTRVVMSGVAKADWELDRAISEGIYAIQLESVEEIARIAARARSLGKTARVSLRINPGVDVDTHAHIATGHDAAKFGISRADLTSAWSVIDGAPSLSAVGVSTHVGSMLSQPEPYLDAARIVTEAARARLASGYKLEFVDLGGGFGVDYGGKPCAPPAEFARAASKLVSDAGLGELALVVEPGRSLVAPFGVLVAKVIQSKVSGERRWLMIDAGMNDLLRPALYQAHHRIEDLNQPPADVPWRVVGPVCESSDDFGEHRLGGVAPVAVAIRDAGAYGFTMASEYNGRALPGEVFVEGGKVRSTSPSPGYRAWVERRLRA